MSKLLQDCGEALYGPLWQSALARDLGTSDRTIRRWHAGQYDAPVGVWMDLMRLMTTRQAEMDDLIERCKRQPTNPQGPSGAEG